MTRRIFAALVVAGAFLVASTGPALATLDESGLTCEGNATITGSDGKTYNINARDDEAVIPRAGAAKYEGSTSPVSHNHEGFVAGDLGPFDILFGEWGSENDDDEPSASGVKEYDIPSWLPPFQMVVFGSHDADEGFCDGDVLVVLTGKSTGVGGLVLMGGTLVFAVGFVSAGFSKAVP